MFLTGLCTSALSLPLAICYQRSYRTQMPLGQSQENPALRKPIKSIDTPPSNVEGAAALAPTAPHSWSKDDLNRQRLHPTPILASKSAIMVWETQEPRLYLSCQNSEGKNRVLPWKGACRQGSVWAKMGQWAVDIQIIIK